MKRNGQHRVFRSHADYHNARRLLDFLGIGLHPITGQVGEMDDALRALMGRALPEKSGGPYPPWLEAVVRSGRNAGGRAYGYRPVPGKPGQLTIDDAEAEIVRRIFREFIEGATPRAIAVGLNADRIAAPRGTRWTATTINGSLARGHGLLMNELYTGDIVWNRVRMVKDPTTGKRISRPNKAGDYRRAQALHLRIIDQETWDAAQTSKRGRSNVGATAARKPFAAAIRALALRILRRRHDRAGRPATRQAASRAVRRLPRKRYLLERPQGFAISHRDAGVRRAAR